MKELIERVQRGDWKAVCAIVEMLRVRIERMGRYYARVCGEDPGDLVQEAWLGVLDALRETDTSIGDPQQFLIQRARWRLLDFIKWNRRRQHEPLEEVLPSVQPSVQEAALDHALTGQFISQLTDIQRALLQHLIAGDTWREAAAKVGCTSANVAYHVRQMRRAYLEYEG